MQSLVILKPTTYVVARSKYPTFSRLFTVHFCVQKIDCHEMSLYDVF